MINKDELKTLTSIESYGQGGSFKGDISIESEKFDSLPKEIRNKISWESSDILRSLQEKIALEWVKVNESDKRDEHISELTKLFKSAGFDSIHVKIISNEYCGRSCCYHLPWIMVTTQKGRIKLGWRKKVINIDWSKSDIDKDGNKIFKGENVTTGKKYVHAWSYDKAIEYLKELNSGTKFWK